MLSKHPKDSSELAPVSVLSWVSGLRKINGVVVNVRDQPAHAAAAKEWSETESESLAPVINPTSVCDQGRNHQEGRRRAM